MQENTNAATIEDHMRRNHTMLEDVGAIAEAANVKTLVLSHVVPHEGVPTEDWIQAVKPTFNGEIILGEDLMEIQI